MLENGVVRTPKGFKEAYRQYQEGGWNSVPFDPEHGGQGLPWTLAMAVQEMWQSANMSFALCPMLTQGADRGADHPWQRRAEGALSAPSWSRANGPGP